MCCTGPARWGSAAPMRTAYAGPTTTAIPLLVTMDGDFTHEPRYIPDLLAESARGADVVVGSRYLLESSLAGWNPWRKALTRIGHLLTLELAPDALRRHQRLSLLSARQDPAPTLRCGRLSWLFLLLREPVRAPSEQLPDRGGSDPPAQAHLRQLEDGAAGGAQQRATPPCDLLQDLLQPGEVRGRRRGRGSRVSESTAPRQPGLGRLLGRSEDGCRELALRRRGRLLPEVDHPPGTQSIRAPLLHAGRAGIARGLRRAGRWMPTSATRCPSRGSTSP